MKHALARLSVLQGRNGDEEDNEGQAAIEVVLDPVDELHGGIGYSPERLSSDNLQ